MHVLQLLNALLSVVHVEVIIPPLPELIFSRHLQFVRGPLLENLQAVDNSAIFISPTRR